MFAMEPFLAWWLDAQFSSEAAPVGEILVVGLWANCLAYVPFALIQGRGRPDLTAKFHLVELLPYLTLLWMAVEWNGAVGAAIAWSLRAWVDAALLFWASRFRQFDALASGVVVLLGAAVATLFTAGTDWRGLAVRGAVLVAAVLWAWWSAPPSLKMLAHHMSRRLWQSEASSA
jgi:O-antigen/teichoic acid export membrane protein